MRFMQLQTDESLLFNHEMLWKGENNEYLTQKGSAGS